MITTVSTTDTREVSRRADALDASVVVCAYTERRWDDLCDAIASVLDQQPGPREVILVVDHNPALLARARRHLDQVIVIPNGHRQGLSGARNTGLEHATGSVVAFLDDDAVAQPGWLTGLVAPFDDPSVTAVGGQVLPSWRASAPAWLPDEFLWVVGCSYRGLPTGTADVRNPIGASMAVRRDPTLAVGGFRDDLGRVGTLPEGCEETELAIRLRQDDRRRRVVYEPAATVHHRVDPVRGTWRYFLQRCRAEGRSKARVAAVAGRRDGLASERRYVTRTLPAGVVRALGDAVTERRPALLLRAAAIVLGLLATAVGYLEGRRAVADPTTAATDPAPALDAHHRRVVQLELSQPLPTDPTGDPRPRRALVRIHGHPLGVLEYPAGTDRGELATRLLDTFGDALTEHLEGDGLAEGRSLPAPTTSGTPPCRQLQGARDDLPLVSVIIPTFRRPDQLARCLRSLLDEQDYPNFELIVVDNDPEASAAPVADAHAGDARVRYLQEPTPGVAAARNAALRVARGEFVANTDDDVEIDPHWLRMLVRRFQRWPDVDAVTGLVEPAVLDTDARVLFEQYGGFGKGYQPRRLDAARGSDNILHPYSPGVYGSGNNLAVRTATLRALGGWDDRFGSGGPIGSGDDIDLFLTLVLDGRTIAYEPAAVVHHHHRENHEGLREQLEHYGWGMGAQLTKRALNGHAWPLLRRVPAGLRWVLSDGSGKNAKREHGFPADLTRAELRGLIAGPFRYLKVVARTRTSRTTRQTTRTARPG